MTRGPARTICSRPGPRPVPGAGKPTLPTFLRPAAWAAAVLAAFCSAPAHAGCTAVERADYDIGERTTGQAASGASQGYDASAGLSCSKVLIGLLSSNRVDATVRSLGGFRLTSASGQSVSYVASPLPDGSRPISQGDTVNYADPALVSLLNLGSRTDFSLPISFLRLRGSGLAAGTYRDVVTVDWDWRVCDGVALLNLVCLFYSEGRARTTISLAVTILDRSPVVTIVTKTTSDPVNGTSAPKAIPGATVVSTVVVTNPDVVALDPDGVVLTVPVPYGMRASVGPSDIRLTQGEGVSLSYGGPSAPDNDVDFACGEGGWTCDPSDAAADLVTSVRAKVKGVLQAGAALTLALSYVIR